MMDFSFIFTRKFFKDFRFFMSELGKDSISYWHYRMRCEGVDCISFSFTNIKIVQPPEMVLLGLFLEY